MILTFSKLEFVNAIVAGTKLHTIREDKKNRWEVGRSIQFWKGNPRNVKLHPFQFGVGSCIRVEEIRMDFVHDSAVINCKFQKLDELAINDGFENWAMMKKWFVENGHDQFFTGKIIYFEYEPRRS